MKDTYVDVKAVLRNGKRVIIEMQVLNLHGFEGRVLHNAAKEYSQQLQKGDDYTLLRPVVALTLTDFVLFPEAEAHVSRFKLLETERLTQYSDDLELVLVELPKFNKSEAQLQTDADRWLYFVKHAGSLQMVPEALRGDPALQAAFDMALESALSREELDVQHRQFDFIRLQRGSIAKGFADGQAKGRAEGRAEGLELGVQRLVAGGMSEAEARRALGLG